MINIFETFLPQLLKDPNPKDPLNGEAASLLINDPEKYKIKVKEYVRKYASDEKINLIVHGQEKNYNSKQIFCTNKVINDAFNNNNLINKYCKR